MAKRSNWVGAALVLGLCVLAGMPCRAVAGAENSEVIYEATVKVLPEVINTVRPMLFGENLEWNEMGFGLWLEDEKKPDPKIMAELKALGITHLRYPGGTQSDIFDWRGAVGEKREPQPNAFQKGEKFYPYFGPEEFMVVCRELNVPGTITLNAGTGTPEMAAGWVEYFKDHDFPVTGYSLGNELYLNENNEPVPGVRFWKTPEEYVAFYKECEAAIEAVAPGTKLGAVAWNDTGVVKLPGRAKDYMKVVLTEIGDRIAFLDLHNSYAPAVRTAGIGPEATEPSDEEFAAAFLAATRYVEQNMAEAKRQLQEYAPDGGKNIPFHITEYGPIVMAFDPVRMATDIAWNRTLTAALYQASLFHTFFREPKVESGNHMPILSPVFGALIGFNPEGRVMWRNAVYYVFQMYSAMAGREVLATAVACPTYDSVAAGFCPPFEEVPLIDATACRSEAENVLTVFVVNRDVKRSANVTLDAGLNSFSVASITTLTADSYQAENSPQAPETIAPKTEEVAEELKEGKLTVTVPKHSLTVVALRAEE